MNYEHRYNYKHSYNYVDIIYTHTYILSVGITTSQLLYLYMTIPKYDHTIPYLYMIIGAYTHVVHTLIMLHSTFLFILTNV